jgi:DNA-binding transcriptional ArsR family regulator
MLPLVTVYAMDLHARAFRLHGVLTCHADADGHCWPSIDLLVEETRMSRSTVMRALRELREAGLVVSERTGRGNAYYLTDPTAEVPPDTEQVSPAGTDPVSPADTQNRPENRPTNRPSPVADAPGAGGAVVTSEPDQPFEGMQVAVRHWTPASMAGECRAAWHAAYADAHGPPDPSIRRQAMGRITQLAKDRTDEETWRALWRACARAGCEGQWQVGRYLAPPPPSAYPERGGNTALRLLLNDRPADTGGTAWPTPGTPELPWNSSP